MATAKRTRKPTAPKRIQPVPESAISASCRRMTGPIMGPIGQALADCIDAGQSIHALAAAIGTTQPTLWRLVSGESDPKASLLQKIASHFGLQFTRCRR